MPENSLEWGSLAANYFANSYRRLGRCPQRRGPNSWEQALE